MYLKIFDVFSGYSFFPSVIKSLRRVGMYVVTYITLKLCQMYFFDNQINYACIQLTPGPFSCLWLHFDCNQV